MPKKNRDELYHQLLEGMKGIADKEEAKHLLQSIIAGEIYDLLSDQVRFEIGGVVRDAEAAAWDKLVGVGGKNEQAFRQVIAEKVAESLIKRYTEKDTWPSRNFQQDMERNATANAARILEGRVDAALKAVAMPEIKNVQARLEALTDAQVKGIVEQRLFYWGKQVEDVQERLRRVESKLP